MSQLSIIRDGATLNKLVTKVIGMGKTYRAQRHIAVVSALYHAAEHGQTAPLNRLYDSFTVNDKSALRGSYVSRIHAAIGGIDWSKHDKEHPVPAEMLQAARENGAWLAYKTDGGFKVREGVKDRRAAFMKLAESSLINPDGRVWMPFDERFIVAEQTLFGDQELLSSMKSLIARANGDKERVESNVSRKARVILTTAFDQLESLIDNIVEEVEAPKAPKPKKAPKAPAEVVAN